MTGFYIQRHCEEYNDEAFQLPFVILNEVKDLKDSSLRSE
jgi:hypothetical protein